MPVSPSGWQASNVVVLPGGPPGQTVVQLQLNGGDFGTASDVAHYASALTYFPLPPPEFAGLRRIDYIIPLCPFTHVTKAGRYIQWAYTPAMVSGGLPLEGSFRFIGRDLGNSASAGPSYSFEHATGSSVTTLFGTDTMRAYALFVGG